MDELLREISMSINEIGEQLKDIQSEMNDNRKPKFIEVLLNDGSENTILINTWEILLIQIVELTPYDSETNPEPECGTEITLKNGEVFVVKDDYFDVIDKLKRLYYSKEMII